MWSYWYKFCASFPRHYSLDGRYWLAPSHQQITPWQAGTSLSQLAKALFLGRQVPPCQAWQAGTTLPRNNSLEGWYKLLPAQQGVIPFQEGTSLYQLDEE
jgi:hypothetical protein